MASATSYWKFTSVGRAAADTETATLDLSELGVIVTPAGSELPSMPRMSMTRSGVSGNGLFAWSLLSTSTVVV